MSTSLSMVSDEYLEEQESEIERLKSENARLHEALTRLDISRNDLAKAIEPEIQKWLDWCGTADEPPEAWSGARIAADAALAFVGAAPPATGADKGTLPMETGRV